jgi:epoxyqueuosine reductase
MPTMQTINTDQLAQQIKDWGQELGFQQVGITDVDMAEHGVRLQEWLKKEYHGEMLYMADHGDKRYRPEKLVPDTLRIITVRMDYMPPEIETLKIINRPQQAYISRYALGRDYHKLMRKRIATLGKKINAALVPLGLESNYRAFVDSAPVMERGLAQKSGQGWIGKNAMLINPKAGSYFFLGELFTDLPLPVDKPFEEMHCGSCRACIDFCPTGAIVDNHVVDGRKCISYLTIELKGSIPEDLRSKMGNRIFGCDDCQLCCPWNKFSKPTQESDFTPRHNLDNVTLIELFNWDEETFLAKTEGTPIRRAGHERWLRNIAVSLGNALAKTNTNNIQYENIINALNSRLDFDSALVHEHVVWALNQQKVIA